MHGNTKMWMEKSIFISVSTCINPSGQPGNSPVGTELTSVVSKSLSANPSSNRPTVNPSKII